MKTKGKFTKKNIALLICLFAALFLLIRILVPNRVYRYEGGYAFETGTGQEKVPVYAGISLPAGTYRVELEYGCDTDLHCWSGVEDGTVFSGGLKCNGQSLYAGETVTDYSMWLYESTDSLEVLVSYDGTGTMTVGSLTIRETDGLWTELLVIVAFVALLIAGTGRLAERIRQGAISERQRKIWFFLTIISIFASVIPLYDCMVGGADLTYHLQRIEGCKDALLSGQFPVRIEPEWLYGEGYANAIFYCPIFLYFPALLRLAGFTVTTAYNIYCIALSFAAAGIAWYSFSRIFGHFGEQGKNDNIALACTALYTLSVFRSNKLYGTGGTGQGTAYTFLPLVACGLYLILADDEEKDQRGWLALALGYAGILQSHILTGEITVFVTILTCLVFLRRALRRKALCQFVRAALCAALLSLWYLVPFVDYYLTQDVHIKYVSARTIQERGLELYELLQLFPEETENGNGPGLLLLAALPVCAVWMSLRRSRKELRRGEGGQRARTGMALWCMVLAVLLCVMSLRIFPWDAIQNSNSLCASLVSSLQFPNRFIGWASLCLILVMGYCLERMRERGIRWRLSGGIWVLAAILTTGCYCQEDTILHTDVLRIYNEAGMGFGYISGAEYLIEGTDYSLLTYHGAECGDGVTISDYDKNYLTVRLSCANESDADSYVDLPLLLYKKYTAEDTATGKSVTITYNENKELRVVIPAHYSGELLVRYQSPFYWRIAEVISILTAALLCGSAWRVRKHAGEAESPAESAVAA